MRKMKSGDGGSLSSFERDKIIFGYSWKYFEEKSLAMSHIMGLFYRSPLLQDVLENNNR